VLFSDDQVARAMNERFECSWESVKKVPRVEIDFGDGHKLTRTLSGNVATYFATSDGRVFDIAPGVMTREAFLARLALAAQQALLLATVDESARAESVERYHATMKDREAGTRRELMVAANELHRPPPPDGSKRMVEARIKDALKGASLLVALRASSAPEAPRLSDKRKMAVERPVKDSLHEDTDYNRDVRAPKIHALLAARPLEPVASYTKTLYKDVLGVDLDDPYLGLAPYVLGGEPGRHEQP